MTTYYLNKLKEIFPMPKVGETVGNCGGHANVLQVFSANDVMVKIPSFSPFRCEVDRGTNGVLMAVKLIK